MPAPAPVATDSLRPIRVFRLSPTPAGVTPRIPEVLTGLLLRELSREPHENPLQCTHCQKVFKNTQFKGQPCSQREGGLACQGVIQLRWDHESATQLLIERMHEGGVAIARTLNEDFSPVGLAVCEVHTPDTVIGATGMSMNALSGIYGILGHEGPYLVVTHLAIEYDGRDLQQFVIELVMKSIESAVKIHKLSARRALVLLDDRSNELRHRSVRTVLGKDYRIVASDTLGDHHRALVPVHFKIHED